MAAKNAANSARNAAKATRRRAALNKNRPAMLGLITGVVPVLDLLRLGGPAYVRVVNDVPAVSRLGWGDVERTLGHVNKARFTNSVAQAFAVAKSL